MRCTVRFATALTFAASAISGTVAAAQGSTSLVKPVSIGISGGVSVPTGDLANGSNGFTGANTGYNVTGSIALGLPVIPIGLRGDIAYNSFGSKNVVINYNVPNQGGSGSSSYNADVGVLGVTANAVYSLPLPEPVIKPYLIGGIGVYNTRVTPTGGSTSSQSNFGFNLGAGVTLPLVVFNAFVEARYHHVNQDNGSMSFVPITVGVMF